MHTTSLVVLGNSSPSMRMRGGGTAVSGGGAATRNEVSAFGESVEKAPGLPHRTATPPFTLSPPPRHQLHITSPRTPPGEPGCSSPGAAWSARIIQPRLTLPVLVLRSTSAHVRRWSMQPEHSKDASAHDADRRRNPEGRSVRVSKHSQPPIGRRNRGSGVIFLTRHATSLPRSPSTT